MDDNLYNRQHFESKACRSLYPLTPKHGGFGVYGSSVFISNY